jgi:hypothetical protein
MAAKRYELPDTPITHAVEPQRKAAVARAREHAQGVVDKVHAKLAEHNWDIDKAAPYPHGKFSRDYNAYKREKVVHDLFHSLTKLDTAKHGSYRVASSQNKEPHYRVPNPEAHAKLLDQAEEQAHGEYDSFIHKLNTKVGDHKSAELTGNHVWGHSILHIEHHDGRKEKWKTQQIFKLSKLGKPHNQWPTRKIK